MINTTALLFTWTVISTFHVSNNCSFYNWHTSENFATLWSGNKLRFVVRLNLSLWIFIGQGYIIIVIQGDFHAIFSKNDMQTLKLDLNVFNFGISGNKDSHVSDHRPTSGGFSQNHNLCSCPLPHPNPTLQVPNCLIGKLGPKSKIQERSTKSKSVNGRDISSNKFLKIYDCDGKPVWKSSE